MLKNLKWKQKILNELNGSKSEQPDMLICCKSGNGGKPSKISLMNSELAILDVHSVLILI